MMDKQHECHKNLNQVGRDFRLPDYTYFNFNLSKVLLEKIIFCCVKMESDSEFECTPPEIKEKATGVSLNLLPETSRYRYETTYQKFQGWKARNNVKSSSENVLLVYFEELSRKYKASTLWSIFSMLKATIKIKHNINITDYMKLQSFLKRKSEKYTPKKSKILTEEDFSKFLNTAPDQQYLLIKVRTESKLYSTKNVLTRKLAKSF